MGRCAIDFALESELGGSILADLGEGVTERNLWREAAARPRLKKVDLCAHEN